MAILGGHAATMLLLLTYLYFSAGNYGEAHNWEKYFEGRIVLFKTYTVQAFLDFRSFDFRDFRFTAVYNSILFSLPFSTTK